MAASSPRRLIKRKQRYQYRPLSSGDGEHEVRLIRLLPGNWRSPIRVEIYYRKCEDLRREWYEAVSYVWASESNPASIHVHDRRFSWTLSVTRNCAQVLRHLRYRHKIRPLWVDAICIDQNNLEERAQQVQLMTAIYRRAAGVLCWLGPRSHDSDIAMAVIYDVSRHVVYEESSQWLKAKDGSRDAHFWMQLGVITPFSEQQTSALINLLRRPWFSRLWIWQEVHMGDKRSSLICGRRKVTWYEFRAFIQACKGKAAPKGGIGLAAQLIATAPLCRRAERTQLGQLEVMRGSDCKKPSDRIYTSEALATLRAARVHLRPDYIKSHQEVYTDFATAYLREKDDLDVLLLLAPLDSSSVTPSWVPDWSRRRQTTSTGIGGCANGRAKSVVLAPGKQRATVKGVLVSTITSVAPTHLKVDMLMPSAVRKCLSRLVATANKLTAQNDMARLVRVLLAGRVNDFLVPPDPQRRTLSELEHALLIIIDSKSRLKSTEMYCIQELNHIARGRCLLATGNKKLGLGPPCQKGDVVAVVLGCTLPLILRPLHDGTFQVLGEAYVEDIMNGEAILGPIPAPFEAVWSRRNGYSASAFRSMETSEVTYHDPRLPPLPEEWEDATDSERPNELWFKHRSTGEYRNGMKADPRCDVEVLEARGVSLRDFILV